MMVHHDSSLTGVGLFAAVFALLLLSGACSDEDDDRAVCTDSTCLTETLAGATPGTTIDLAAGTFEGSFVAPSGVTLIGAGPEATTIRASGDAAAVTVAAGPGTTTIANLAVEGAEDGGIRAVGDGSGGLVLTDVTVSAAGWVAVFVQKLASFTAARVELSGNLTTDEFSGISIRPDGEKWALAGMVMHQIGEAELSEIDATLFAMYGVVAEATPVTWTGGEIHDIVATGIYIGGPYEVSLNDLESHHIAAGATPYGYGIVATNGVHLVTNGVNLHDNAIAGMVIDHSTGDHADADINSNGSRGLWIQFCGTEGAQETAVTVHGANTVLDNNKGVTFGAYQSHGISLSDATISNTQTAPMVAADSEIGLVEVGDGINGINSNGLVFTDLNIENSIRAGVLLDGSGLITLLAPGDPPVLDVTFTNVTVSGDAGERGFVVQNATVESTPEVSAALQAKDQVGTDLDIVKELTTDKVPDPQDINSNG